MLLICFLLSVENGEEGGSSERHGKQGEALLHGVADDVRDRHQVRANQAYRERSLRGSLLIGKPRDQREGRDKTDKQCLRQSRGRAEDASRAEAPSTLASRECYLFEGYNDACT